MRIAYNLMGAERRSLVDAISQELNAPAKYLGMPTAAYEISGYTISKLGTVEGEDNRGLVTDLNELHGLVAVNEQYDYPLSQDNDPLPYGEMKLTGREAQTLGKEQSEDIPDEGGMLTIEMPLTGFTPDKLDNLTKLVNAKATLLKAALGIDDLPIRMTGETLQFPWFKGTIDAEHAAAYTILINLLCKTAIEKKRVTAKEKPIEGSSRYAFRCFLLSLGFIGEEYKAARRILLSGVGLSGNTSWKNNRKTETETEMADDE